MTQAQEPIRVMVAKSPGVPDTVALSKLIELNMLMSLSGLGSHLVENAGDHVGAPGIIFSSTCIGANVSVVLACMKLELGADRDIYNADIVLLVVPQIDNNICGAVPDAMINRSSITTANHTFGFAVVSVVCNLPGVWYTTSHEFLHLLSIEHKSYDPDLEAPERDNHSYSAVNYVTAGGVPNDCISGCNAAVNKMSTPYDTFPNSFPMGNSTHANARRVVEDISWDVVASYRPLPSPPDCKLTYELLWCQNGTPNGVITASLPGYNVSNADYDIQIGGIGGWIDIFEGALTCPYVSLGGSSWARAILQTSQGVSECSIWISLGSCDDDVVIF